MCALLRLRAAWTLLIFFHLTGLERLDKTVECLDVTEHIDAIFISGGIRMKTWIEGTEDAGSESWN